MRLLRGIGKWFWRFMVIFSFIVNFVLIVILLLAGLFIFQIKDQVADPLIGGLHSTAVGLKAINLIKINFGFMELAKKRMSNIES